MKGKAVRELHVTYKTTLLHFIKDSGFVPARYDVDISSFKRVILFISNNVLAIQQRQK